MISERMAIWAVLYAFAMGIIVGYLTSYYLIAT